VEPVFKALPFVTQQDAGMEEEDLVIVGNESAALIVSPRKPSDEPDCSEAINRSNANHTSSSTTCGPLPSIDSPKDVVTRPVSQETMYVNKHPTKALLEGYQFGGSTEDEIDLMSSPNNKRLSYMSGLPVQTKLGLAGLEKHCPPLASTVSYL
jgi:hypothetical protein